MGICTGEKIVGMVDVIAGSIDKPFGFQNCPVERGHRNHGCPLPFCRQTGQWWFEIRLIAKGHIIADAKVSPCILPSPCREISPHPLPAALFVLY